MSLTIFQSDKTPFQVIKTRSSRSRKIVIFPKGLSHGFGAEMAIFPNFFFRQYRPVKNAFLDYQNKKYKKSKYLHFSKGVNPWVWSKNGHFSNFFFYAIQTRKMCLTIFLGEKTPLQAIKNRSSKNRKNDIFPKGLTHGFCPIMAIFGTFFLGNICQENVFSDILKGKNSFLGQKNKKFKKSKN